MGHISHVTREAQERGRHEGREARETRGQIRHKAFEVQQHVGHGSM